MKRSVICAINSTPPTPSSRIRNSSWFINWGHRKFLEIRSSESSLGFLFLTESSRHNETTGLWPTMQAVVELGHLPLVIHGFIGDAGEQSFERRGQTRGHRILCAPSFQSGRSEERRVGKECRTRWSPQD